MAQISTIDKKYAKLENKMLVQQRIIKAQNIVIRQKLKVIVDNEGTTNKDEGKLARQISELDKKITAIDTRLTKLANEQKKQNSYK